MLTRSFGVLDWKCCKSCILEVLAHLQSFYTVLTGSLTILWRIILLYNDRELVPVASRSKAWVCGRSVAVIVGSNPTGVMDVCLL